MIREATARKQLRCAFLGGYAEDENHDPWDETNRPHIVLAAIDLLVEHNLEAFLVDGASWGHLWDLPRALCDGPPEIRRSTDDGFDPKAVPAGVGGQELVILDRVRFHRQEKGRCTPSWAWAEWLLKQPQEVPTHPRHLRNASPPPSSPDICRCASGWSPLHVTAAIGTLEQLEAALAAAPFSSLASVCPAGGLVQTASRALPPFTSFPDHHDTTRNRAAKVKQVLEFLSKAEFQDPQGGWRALVLDTPTPSIIQGRTDTALVHALRFGHGAQIVALLLDAGATWSDELPYDANKFPPWTFSENINPLLLPAVFAGFRPGAAGTWFLYAHPFKRYRRAPASTTHSSIWYSLPDDIQALFLTYLVGCRHVPPGGAVPLQRGPLTWGYMRQLYMAWIGVMYGSPGKLIGGRLTGRGRRYP